MSARSLIAIPGFADPFSSLSHLIGAAVFLALGVLLVRRGIRTGHSGPRIASLAVFSFSAVLLLSMSGTFHLLGTQGGAGQARLVMQRLDHAAIFVLIAGTFTPVHAILFRGVRRWGVLALIWTLAVLGVTLKSIYFRQTPAGLGLGLYVGMGWIGALSMFLAARRWGMRFVTPLILGGVFYTIGAVIEHLGPRPLIAGVVRAHEVFHVMVLAGLGFHWWFIWQVASSAWAEPGDAPTRGGTARDETSRTEAMPNASPAAATL